MGTGSANVVPCGTLSSRTMIVVMMAITPTLKAAIRPLPITYCLRCSLPPCLMLPANIWTGISTSARFDYALTARAVEALSLPLVRR